MEGKAGTKHARRYKWVTIGSRPFDFLGVGGRERVISEMNIISWRLILRKKIIARKYLAKKNATLKKKSFIAYNAGKNLTPLYVRKKLYHQRFGKKKNSYTNQITHTPPTPWVKWSAPYEDPPPQWKIMLVSFSK